MSESHSKHVTVWVQNFGDRPYPVLQWHDPDTGSRKSKSAETCNPIGVERARSALEYELNHGLYRQAASMSWERFRQLFEAEFVATRRPDTRRNYRIALDLFEQICHPRTLRSVNERMVSAYRAGLFARPGVHPGTTMAESSVKVRLQFLRTALAWAARQKLLPDVPRFDPVKVPRTRPRATPGESFERLLAKAPDDQTRVFLLCGWKAGLRLNEALALEWEETDKAPWLDPQGGRIWLPAGFVKAVEDQWVPLDPDLWEALGSLPRQGRKVFRFVESRSGKPVGDKAVCNRVSKLARQAGVRLTMKELRKGFGCAYAGKVPAQVLQKLMRHSNIRITMDYYANVDDAAMAAVLGDKRNSLRNMIPDAADAIEAEPSQTQEGQGDRGEGSEGHLLG
jgi:integrase